MIQLSWVFKQSPRRLVHFVFNAHTQKLLLAEYAADTGLAQDRVLPKAQ